MESRQGMEGSGLGLVIGGEHIAGRIAECASSLLKTATSRALRVISWP